MNEKPKGYEKPKGFKHQRRVTISAVLPSSVTLIVGTDDDEPDDGSDWEIASVVDVRCEATPRLISENMHSEDFEALYIAAAKAKDLP
jgi:hypothetical protein